MLILAGIAIAALSGENGKEEDIIVEGANYDVNDMGYGCTYINDVDYFTMVGIKQFETE